MLLAKKQAIIRLIPSYDQTNGICCQAVGCDMSDEISNNFHNTKSKSKSAKQLLSGSFAGGSTCGMSPESNPVSLHGGPYEGNVLLLW